MADPRSIDRDAAGDGGGIGDVGRQPIDRTSENPGEGTPAVPPSEGEDTEGVGLTVDEDATPSGEDPDDEADETLGTVV